MTKYVVGFFGFLAWITAIGLTITLVLESTIDQSAVAIGVAGLAIGLSAFGLAFARYSWTRRAYPEIAIGTAMWMAGVVCLGFIEISYWVSSYEARYDKYSHERKAKARHEALVDRDWQVLTTGEGKIGVGQLEAMIAAKKMEPAVARSAECTNVTRIDSRAPCREFFDLKAQLAAAQQREKLETSILADQKVASAKTTDFSSNVFAAAELMARWRGGDVKDWAYVIMLWSWLLVTLVRDCGLLIMNPLGRPRKAQEADKAPSVAELAAQIVLPPVARPLPILDAHPKPRHIDTDRLGELGKLMREAAAADETPITTPPAGGGTPMPAVIEEKQVLPAKAENVVKLRPQEDMPTKAKSTTKGEGSVIRWLEECSSQDASEQQKTTSQACFKSYQAWCRINGYHAVNAKVLSRRIAAHLKMPASKSGKRNSSGRIFPTLVIYMPASETQRRYG